jgi:hypothetical protein
MSFAGEYGAEALDSYETMSKHYPAHWKPTPSKDADTLWGHVQTKKAGSKQIMGFRGKTPKNLGQYIEASQNYQADVLSEVTKGFRLSPRRISGYFQFHFIDVLPAEWPKSIVSHDLTPKKGYFVMAQLNQPLVPLPRITNHCRTMELWVANDTEKKFDNARLKWSIAQNNDVILQGEEITRIKNRQAAKIGQVDLTKLPSTVEVIDVVLKLFDDGGTLLSKYRQEIYLPAFKK